MTETIYALGQEKCLVGRSNVCNYPEAAKKIPIAGHFGRPDVERVITLKPDYVICSALADKAMIKRFKRFNIKVFFLPAKSFDDYFRTLEILGKILDCPEKAELLCRRGRAELTKLKQTADKIPEEKKKKVLFVIWDMPLMTIGKDSFITDMISLAGGISVTDKHPQAYFTCALEWILANPPDILVFPKIPSKRVRELIKRPGWKTLEAVKRGRLFYKINPDLLCRMGPRTIEGIKQLQKVFKSVETK
ncbi:MAG: ABC transporter substrate-binding protein [Victivallaceae bacterium]|nr:ABC transporter substrate-binding protein [Victivallaceae bacterium]